MQHQQVQNAKDNVSKKATIREDFIFAAFNRAYTLTDYDVYNNLNKRYMFRQQTIYNDTTLTRDEKNEAIKILERRYDYDKIISNEGVRRICENCQEECLAKLYCEHCIRNYLKAKFINWTSGNDDIDDLIQKCQIVSIGPNKIIEWIPYNNLQDINYLTRGGFSEIFSAEWTDGHYQEWDPETQQLKRNGKEKVILKNLKNVESVNRSWFEEAKSHLTISSRSSLIVKCYGLTQDQTNGHYMLVMHKMKINLRKYLLQHQPTWKERIQIAYDIIESLRRIHEENAIHRDLHSENILFRIYWYIGDLGFCGPADKPLKSIYGNLPYVAPEVIIGNMYTYASDIYSFGILMWEISSGQQPFKNHEHNYDLAMKIVNGMRPKIISGTPPEYEKLMIQCWDANPSNRPNTSILHKKVRKMWQDSYNNTDEFNTLKYDDSSQILQTNSSSKLYSLSTSKLYQFENLPEPRNATEEEQEAFHSNPYDFSIPDNIEDFCSKDKLDISENIAEKLGSLNLKKGMSVSSEGSVKSHDNLHPPSLSSSSPLNQNSISVENEHRVHLKENILPYQDSNLSELVSPGETKKSEKSKGIKKFKSKISKIFKKMSCIF